MTYKRRIYRKVKIMYLNLLGVLAGTALTIIGLHSIIVAFNHYKNILGGGGGGQGKNWLKTF